MAGLPPAVSEEQRDAFDSAMSAAENRVASLVRVELQVGERALGVLGACN